MSDLTVRGIRIENLEKQVAELEAELQMAYENADFDEPLTFKEYRADLQEQAAARAKYEAERGVRG